MPLPRVPGRWQVSLELLRISSLFGSSWPLAPASSFSQGEILGKFQFLGAYRVFGISSFVWGQVYVEVDSTLSQLLGEKLSLAVAPAPASILLGPLRKGFW